jgi:hypothetical protein
VKRRSRARQRGSPKTNEATAARFRRERDEALEQQAAVAEVLRVISSSPGELGPVFDVILERAARLCRAAFGSLLLKESKVFRRVAVHNPPPLFAEFHKKTPNCSAAADPRAENTYRNKSTGSCCGRRGDGYRQHYRQVCGRAHASDRSYA